MYSNNTKPITTVAPKSIFIPSFGVTKNLSPITLMNLKRLCTAANSSVSLYELKPSTKAIYRIVGLTAWSQLAISAYFGPLLIVKGDQFGDPAQAGIKKAIGFGVIAYGIAINVAFNIFRKKIALKVDYVNDKVKVGMMNMFTATKTVEFPASSMIYKKQLPIGESSFYTLSFRSPFNQDKTIRYYLDKQGNYPNKHVLENLEQRAAGTSNN